MNSNEVRRVAVIGGSRIPFARAYTSYRDQTTQDLMIASLKGLVEKYRLQGETLGDVSLGAVIKHSSQSLRWFCCGAIVRYVLSFEKVRRATRNPTEAGI